MFDMKYAVILAGLAANLFAADLPKDYKLLYEQDFDQPEALQSFQMTDRKAWKFAAEKDGGGAMELAQQSKYEPSVRSPVNIALIKDKAFGDFVLEVNLKQTGREYGHRDMCLFFGFQDPSHFYYTHIATKADPHAHNIFIVNGEPRANIARKTTDGVNWGLEVWHQVRLERKLADGSIKVFFDDMSEPIMIAEDKTFGAGPIGFGSFDDTGKVDHIRIWGPSVEKPKAPIKFDAKP